MKNLLYLAFLLISFSINAQIQVGTSISKVDSLFSPKLTGELYKPDTISSRGEQFFNREWVESAVILSTGDRIDGVKIKYNGFLDEVIWQNTSNFKKFKLDKSYICEFWLKDEMDSTIHFQRLNITDSTVKNPSGIFVEVAVEGTLSLYIQHKVSHLVDELVAYKYFIIYEKTPLYYIKLPSNLYFRMSDLNRKDFLNLFPKQKKTLSKMFRANHLNLKTEKGLIRAIDLMNKNGMY